MHCTSPEKRDYSYVPFERTAEAQKTYYSWNFYGSEVKPISDAIAIHIAGPGAAGLLLRYDSYCLPSWKNLANRMLGYSSVEALLNADDTTLRLFLLNPPQSERPNVILHAQEYPPGFASHSSVWMLGGPPRKGKESPTPQGDTGNPDKAH